MKPDQRVFVGVVAPIDPHVETPEEVRDRVLEAAEYIPVAQLGTTDDCGFSPFCDDTSTTRETAFAKIRARVLGTALAADALGDRVWRDWTTRRQLLRSVALQNASSILLARQRAEEELLRTKEALRESQERLRAALTAAGTGTFRWNIQTNTVEWDGNLDRLFGFRGERDDAVARRVHRSRAPRRSCRRDRRLEQCARDGVRLRHGVPRSSGRMAASTGSRTRRRRSATNMADRCTMTGACADVTAARRAEEALRMRRGYSSC